MTFPAGLHYHLEIVSHGVGPKYKQRMADYSLDSCATAWKVGIVLHRDLSWVRLLKFCFPLHGSFWDYDGKKEASSLVLP